MSIRTYLNSPINVNKRIKIVSKPTVPIVFCELKYKRENNSSITLKTLLDSGASTSVISTEAVRHLKKTNNDATEFNTMAGTFKTKKKCNIRFKMPELNFSAEISTKAHVADMNGMYNIIVGRDLLHNLGIDLNFSTKTVQWNEKIIDMKPPTCTKETSFHVDDSTRVSEASDRISKILDAKYAPTDLPVYVQKINNLSEDEQIKLLKILRKHEDLYDGSLGTWKGTSYKIELRDNVKLYHARARIAYRKHMNVRSRQKSNDSSNAVFSQRSTAPNGQHPHF